MSDAIYLFDKPAGVTSFEALRPFKRAAGTGKVGHTGTLDKFATGLLIVLTGRLTRLNQLFLGLDKEYSTAIRLGEETDTLDPEGRTVRTGPVPGLLQLEEVIPQFNGRIEQVPPHYSAVHVGGRRAHQLSRGGEKFDMPSRVVTVHELSIERFDPPHLQLRIRCSKGCYVRSIARDLASAAGSAGYVAELRRTGVGPYSVEDALTEREVVDGAVTSSVRRLLDALPEVAVRTVDRETAERMRHGGSLRPSWFEDCRQNTIAAFDEEEELVAVVERSEQRTLKYRLVIPEKHAHR